MTSHDRPRVFTIAAGTPFVDALAAGLRERAGDEPLALGRMTVLLPTRRACRALQQAFLRAGEGRPTLLPAMRPIGDVDEDETLLAAEEAGGPFGGAAPDDPDLPPAVSPLRRQLLLTRLIGKVDGDAHRDTARAAELAAELARLLDQVQTERLGFEALADLVPDDYAAHWQVTLDFLKVLTEHWPGVLAEQGLLDPTVRRDRLIGTLAARWREAPPADQVIAAGSTGSVPATAELLGVVARLPQGMVVLPGLDVVMDEAAWEVLDPSHPQYGMKQLLPRLGVERGDVAPWPAPGSDHGNEARAALVAEALLPAPATGGWQRERATSEGALDGLVRVDAPGPQEEARAIALVLRRALETPGRTAALVTPDRRLARRVTGELRRWGIEIDDSAGIPLAETAPGNFLRLSAEMVAERAAPVPLLAALKHPLAAAGRAPGAFRAMVRGLERLALRGPRPAPGFEGIAAALPDGERGRDAGAWLEALGKAAAPFADALAREAVPLADLVRRHVAFAEWLAADKEGDGAARLWAGDAGEQVADFVSDLLEAAPVMDSVAGGAYPALLTGLMRGRVVRPHFGRHPRLNIWGLLEARLQRADLLVLGGLNEGTWPAEPPADPWLSRPMRARFGLPAPERRIGLAAHDFAQAACAPMIVLTRAEKVDGTPTVPSRWLLRLDKLIKARGLEWPAGEAAALRHWQARLDAPAVVAPVAPPEPRPPVAARPRRLSVTRIETWMRDPYAIYARYVLNLQPLEPLNADPGAAERGTFIHKALDSFLREFPETLPEDAVERLLAQGRAAFGPALDRPSVRALWWPRFERIAAWFVAEQRRRSETGRTLATEVSASLLLPGPAGGFELRATADRIDQVGGGLAIIDYKTGQLPRTKDVGSGYAPQLPLEAMLAEAGAFEGIAAGTVVELAFWRLPGGEPPGVIKTLKGDPAEAAAAAREGLCRLIAAFDDPATPYRARPRPEAAPAYSDYEHLARVKEWSAGIAGEAG